MILESLCDSIDPDALDSLIRTMETHSTNGQTTVAYMLNGHEVTVQRDGTGVVRPVEARTESK